MVYQRTVKVTLAVYGQTPARVLGQGVEHVVKEANSSVDGNLLRLAGLRGMAVTIIEETGVGVRGKATTVQVEGELDLGLVGVAGESGPAGRLRGGHLESQLEVNEGDVDGRYVVDGCKSRGLLYRRVPN